MRKFPTLFHLTAFSEIFLSIIVWINLPPSNIGNGSILIIPMKKEIIHSHNKNIDTFGSFHSMKFITGLYAK